MKKLNILLLSIVLLFVVSSCSWIELNPETSVVGAKISSRRIGFEIQQHHPLVAQKVSRVCDAIIAGESIDETKPLINHLITALAGLIEDPMLASDISDLLSLIKIKPDIQADITEIQLQLIKIIATGLKTGIEMGESNGR